MKNVSELPVEVSFEVKDFAEGMSPELTGTIEKTAISRSTIFRATMHRHNSERLIDEKKNTKPYHRLSR